MAIHALGPFRLDTQDALLLRGNEPVALGRRAIALLRAFVERPGALVSKDALIEAAWSGQAVEESSLTVQIAALRRVLGEAPGGERWIETMPHRGYRFIGPVVTEVEQGVVAPPPVDAAPGAQQIKNIAEPVHVFSVSASRAAPAAEAPVPLTLPDKPSVAVLPFVNMSSDTEQEFLSDGISEDIITALSRYPSLFVIARNSSFTYKGRPVDVKGIGRELGVRYVLEGGLRKSGNRIRVTAQLVEAETGKHVWAERYDRDLTDMFAVQDEITDAVTIAIAPAIAEAEQQRAMQKPPGSLDAWAAYQRGLWHLSKCTPDDNSLAQKFFQQAIDLDPSFSGAYGGLAMAQGRAISFEARGLLEAISSIEVLARRAVAIDGADAEARSGLATALRQRGDYAGALAEAQRALATAPNLAYAHHELGATLIFSGRPKEGLAALERSIRLDPRPPESANRLNQLALGLYFCREYEAAKRAIRA
jgi:adenylate cyclase